MIAVSGNLATAQASSECVVEVLNSCCYLHALFVAQSWFYESAGASAWGDSGPVPFDITSNAYIAHQYAAIAMPLLLEVTPPLTEEGSHTLSLVELGAGHVSGDLQYRGVPKFWTH